MAKSWKDFLLRSGLPLENDIRAYLASKGCLADFEYSYLRRDEAQIEKEFSYDVDASYIKGTQFIELMVECKYRHETTRWVFTPREYGGPEEVYSNCFMHPCDHFIGQVFPFKGPFPEQLAPLCSKGIELTSSGDNEKSITQAIHQLSYAFAPKVMSAIEHQIHQWLSLDFIFYHVPVVATTAQLFRLRRDVDIEAIRSANEIGDVADNLNCIVVNHSIGRQLEEYNLGVFSNLRAGVGDAKMKQSLSSFTEDLGHLFSVLAGHYCPQVIVVVHYSKRGNGFESLFDYIDRLMNPPPDLKEKLVKYQQSLEDVAARLESLVKERSRRETT